MKFLFPPLAMIDDVLAVSECGVESVELNSYHNTQTNLKKLQYGAKKCHAMHVGVPKNHCPDLFIDSWKMEKIDTMKVGIKKSWKIFLMKST